jgi:hypothetical protein
MYDFVFFPAFFSAPGKMIPICFAAAASATHAISLNSRSRHRPPKWRSVFCASLRFSLHQGKRLRFVSRRLPQRERFR